MKLMRFCRVSTRWPSAYSKLEGQVNHPDSFFFFPVMSEDHKKANVPGPAGTRKGKIPNEVGEKELVNFLNELKERYPDTFFQVASRDDKGTHVSGADVTGAARQGVVDYPVRLFHGDPHDELIALKRELIGTSGSGATPLGQAVVTRDDLEYFARKKQMEQAASFKQFVASLYNKNDPAQRAMLKRAYPELEQEQKQIIEDRCELSRRLAMLALDGEPKDENDLKLLFALASGILKPPVGNLWDPETWKDQLDIAGKRTEAITRGMFSRNIYSKTTQPVVAGWPAANQIWAGMGPRATDNVIDVPPYTRPGWTPSGYLASSAAWVPRQ